MLGVRDTEWDRKVSVADCVIVLFRKNSKFYLSSFQNLLQYTSVFFVEITVTTLVISN